MARRSLIKWMFSKTAAPFLMVSGFGILLIGLTLYLYKPVTEMIPTRTGEPERCLTCHTGIEDISVSHTTEEFGCVACHGGERRATTQAAAHSGMVRNPGALDVAQQYCGECHAAQVYFVQHSIMTTYSGAISLIRRTFGLQSDGIAQYAISAVDHLAAFVPASTDPQPVQNFAKNCLTCHLSAEPVAEDYYHRSTGCSACHVLYSETGLYEGADPTIPPDEAGHAQTHQFTTAIPYTQCNHCHNRGNYDLRSMTFVPRPDIPAPAPLTGDAKRLHDYYQPIGKFTRCEWELDCIDCHTSLEVMGDGHLYNNRSEAQYIQCLTCHGTLASLPLQRTILAEDDLALQRAALNEHVALEVGDTIIITERDEPFYHVRQTGDDWTLTSKATGTNYSVPLVMGSECQQKPDEQSSSACHACHSYDRTQVP